MRLILATMIFLLSAPLISNANDADLTARAAQYYQDSNWTAAAESYAELTQKQPDNLNAWYRLANSLIELRRGDDALLALDKAAANTAIPASQLAYQYAQVYKLTEQSNLAWEKLAEAVDGRYSNEQTMAQASIWDDWRELDRFKKLAAKVTANAHPCVYDSRFAEFDFWLGEWTVYGNTEKTGPLYGNNTIEKIEDGCLVMERWRGAGGTTGTSMNYYDGTKDKWVQHWVSIGGTTINVEGGIVDGSMKLVGQIYYLTAPEPKIRDFRALWTPLENGVVRQFFEESTDGGKSWTTWFEGFYFPESQAAGN